MKAVLIMTTNTDITKLTQQLRKAAKKATKGPWIAEREHFHNNGNLAGIYVDQGGKGRGGCVLECFSNCLVHPDSQVKNNALYVALANPVNISLILDALESAQEHIAELEASQPVAPEWISVSDRLPENEDYVLAADSYDKYLNNPPRQQVACFGDWFGDGEATWDDGDGNDLILNQVTHWMPLPAAPALQEG